MQHRQRLTGSKRFTQIHVEGSSAANRLLVIRYLANGSDCSRFGFLVNKRIGNAAVRNRVKRRLREAVRKCVDLLKDPAYSGIIEERTAPQDIDLASDQTLDDWLLRNVSSSFHISGTCKMGTDSDQEAVVDQRRKVRGVEGLRVVDASVMPDVVRANTNVTTMMIAERAAEFIKQGL